MPTKSDIIRLRHMLHAAQKAMEFPKGKERRDLDRDEKLAQAIVRLIEIIGEAAAKVSPGIQTRHPQLPWKDIIGTRNRLIHGYEQVDYDIVWKIVSGDLPPLGQQLGEVLTKEARTEQEALWT